MCPSGQIIGLTYSPDTLVPFRSTGSIVGPLWPGLQRHVRGANHNNEDNIGHSSMD